MQIHQSTKFQRSAFSGTGFSSLARLFLKPETSNYLQKTCTNHNFFSFFKNLFRPYLDLFYSKSLQIRTLLSAYRHLSVYQIIAFYLFGNRVFASSSLILDARDFWSPAKDL